MEKYGKVLELISKKQNTSQRELAAHTGLSLGNINLVIQRMVKQGFIKIEHLSPSTIRYILTPQGLAEKTVQTYRYILNSFRHVLQLKQELERIVKQYMENGYSIYLYGEDDEIRKILKQLISEGILCTIQLIESQDEILIDDGKFLILIWQTEKECQLQRLNAEYLNLLNCI